MNRENAIRDIMGQLYKDHAVSLRAFVLRKTKSAVLADDITNETFLQCLVFLQQKGQEAIRMDTADRFLKGIAFYRIIDEVRRNARRQTVFLDGVYEQTGTAPLVSDEIERKETQQRVSLALRRLDLRKQKMLFLRYFDGLTISEISVAMGVTNGIVKNQLFRARQKLREQLE